MRLPVFNADDPATIDYEQFEKMVDYYMERGFTYFDTAYPYHQEHSEGAVARCLVDRYPRESFVLADKMPIIRVKSVDDYEKYFNEQLERTHAQYFDYYLLHNMGQDRYENTQKFGGFDFIQKKKEEGLVKKIGFSFHDNAEMLDRVLTDHPEVDFVQLQINYLDWNSGVIESGKCYDVAAKHGKPVVVMEPVKGGTLANLPAPALEVIRNFEKEHDLPEMSPASYAIRYAASKPNVMMVLSGMSNMEQLVDNTSYMQEFEPLSEAEEIMLEVVAEVINASTAVACTNCKYCTEVCPKNINIPAYFALLNMYATTGKKTNMYYERYKMNRGLASDCVKCGLCENICPQHLPIRDDLVKFKELYENQN